MINYRSFNYVYRLVLMVLLLSFVTDAHALFKGFKKIKETQYIQIGKDYFRVDISIEIPTKYPTLYNRIRHDMFRNDTIDFMNGVDAFVKSVGGKQVKNSSSKIEGIMPFKGYCSNLYKDKFLLYEIIYATVVDGELIAMKKNYIYSIIDDALLDSQNIFAPTANIKSVKGLTIDNSSNDVRFNKLVITSFDDNLVTTISIPMNKALFSDMFLKLFDWNMLDEVGELERSEEGLTAVDKYLAYRDDKSSIPHIYTLNDDYYVNRLNMDITELSDSELRKLPKEVQQDIKVLKEIIAETPENPVICHNPDKKAEYIFNGKDDFYGYVIKKLNNNARALDVLNNKGGGKLDIQFVVEPDGTTSAPVVRDISGARSLAFVSPLFKQIRNSDKWQPAIKDGKPVRSIVLYTFNLVAKRSD